MGVRRLYVKSPNSLGTKHKTRAQKGREPCSQGMVFKLCLEGGQEEAKCRWKRDWRSPCKSRETASCLRVIPLHSGSKGRLNSFETGVWPNSSTASGKLLLRDLKHQRKWARQTVWVCLEEEEEKAHLHRESVMKTVHVLRPENIVVMCTQLNSTIATSCWSEK